MKDSKLRRTRREQRRQAALDALHGPQGGVAGRPGQTQTAIASEDEQSGRRDALLLRENAKASMYTCSMQQSWDCPYTRQVGPALT